MRAVVDEIKENKVKTAVCTPLPEYHIRVIVHKGPLSSLEGSKKQVLLFARLTLTFN